ncbi:MAG TPA: glycosyltransferase family 4 protein [Candidatus Brocadiia bacterium]|nr:glycosyltransferase family 4 protein [Candidatus Brocadiales bacterium]
MNILIISPVFPYPLDEGAKERIFQVIKGLSRQNTIHLITFYRNQNELQYLSELNKYCIRVDTVHNPRWSMLKTVLFNLFYFFSPMPTLIAMHQSREMKRRIEYALTNNHYDIIQIELTQMASYLQQSRGTLQRAPTTVLVEHDVTFISRYRRLAHAPNPLIKLHWSIQYLKLKHFEITYCKKFDLIITVSEQSKTELQKYCPTSKISVIRTGVDVPSQSPLERGDLGVCSLLKEGKGACELPSKKRGKGVCFIGSFLHRPNQDAVIYFYQSIFPLIKQSKNDAEFLIVGKGPEILPKAIREDKSVRLFGFVNDIKPLLEDAISIVPIRYGSGIRTKILTYMSYGSPVISTSLGAEGLEVTHGENIIIADEPQEFATAIVNLMKDEELRKRIATGGYNLAKEKYQWDKSIHELQNEYIGVLKNKHHENIT